MSLKINCRSIAKATLTIFVLASPLGFAAQAQDWPISNPPVEASVPQYRPPKKVPPDFQPAPIGNSVNEPQAPGESVLANDFQTPAEIYAPTEISADASEPAAAFGIDYTEFRDRNVFPVSPLKKCNPCTHPAATRPRTKLDLPGVRGRPYQDKEPGGCLCGKKCCPKCNQFSVYWPRPFSARLDEKFPKHAAKRQSFCQKKSILDVFDHCHNFELIPYRRKDNGYCGRGCDPYGCLGESRYVSRVAVVGYRPPGEPAVQPAPFNLSR
jgi:hypothetical protein